MKTPVSTVLETSKVSTFTLRAWEVEPAVPGEVLGGDWPRKLSSRWWDKVPESRKFLQNTGNCELQTAQSLESPPLFKLN